MEKTRRPVDPPMATASSHRGTVAPTQDLSHCHAPLTRWFSSEPPAPPPVYGTSGDQGDHRRGFEREGFVGPITVLTGEEVVAVRAAVDDVMGRLAALEPRLYEVEQGHRDRPDEVVCHFLGGWMVHPVLHDLVFHPGIARLAAGLLGVERLRFWHDQVFAKPAHHPGTVPWHQDYSYWTRTAPACHVTVHVALDDADEDNGCLHYLPGSHRCGLLPKVPFDGAMDAVKAHLPGGSEWRPRPMRLWAGEAVFHHSHVLHGSFGNRSDRPRRAAVLNYMGAAVRAVGADPLLRGTARQVPGAPVQGRWFPVVWPTACRA